MGRVNAAFALTQVILFGLWLGALGMSVFALVHAVRQRSDAFTAVDKMTKPIWLAILAGSLGFLLLAFASGSMLLSFIAIIATGVYLADVRPKVDEVQRGPRW
ncbi:DUF2516 family protein [Nocardia thailandica]|uniref:DUF2516 family protein n=1 Tax=Nocardia thailandica TaxID=257275 RepID=A0ABW6PT60_9NOCA|nr:DUF2516 family protein [Nocardia thailandica]